MSPRGGYVDSPASCTMRPMLRSVAYSPLKKASGSLNAAWLYINQLAMPEGAMDGKSVIAKADSRPSLLSQIAAVNTKAAPNGASSQPSYRVSDASSTHPPHVKAEPIETWSQSLTRAKSVARNKAR